MGYEVIHGRGIMWGCWDAGVIPLWMWVSRALAFRFGKKREPDTCGDYFLVLAGKVFNL